MKINDRYIYLAAIVLLIAFLAFLVTAGCVGRETKDVVIVDKFETTMPCGYGSSTGFWVLGSDGIAYLIADSCSGEGKFAGQYAMWSNMQPGDVVRVHA